MPRKPRKTAPAVDYTERLYNLLERFAVIGEAALNPPKVPAAVPPSAPGYYGMNAGPMPPVEPFAPGYGTPISPRDIARKAAATSRRARIISPNKDSEIDIETFAFPLSGHLLKEGQECHFSVSGCPSVTFRAQELRINVTKPGVLFIKYILIANVNANLGGGRGGDRTSDENALPDYWIDAFDYSARATAIPFDLPTITPANTLRVDYFYTGESLRAGKSFWRLTTTFKGPGTIV